MGPRDLRRTRKHAASPQALLQERNQLLAAKGTSPNPGKASPDRDIGNHDAGVPVAAKETTHSVEPASEATVRSTAATRNGPARMPTIVNAIAAENTIDGGSKRGNILDGIGEPPTSETRNAMVEADGFSGGGSGGDGGESTVAGGSAVPLGWRRVEGADGGVASGAELAAVKEQVRFGGWCRDMG